MWLFPVGIDWEIDFALFVKQQDTQKYILKNKKMNALF